MMAILYFAIGSWRPKHQVKGVMALYLFLSIIATDCAIIYALIK